MDMICTRSMTDKERQPALGALSTLLRHLLPVGL